MAHSVHQETAQKTIITFNWSLQTSILHPCQLLLQNIYYLLLVILVEVTFEVCKYLSIVFRIESNSIPSPNTDEMSAQINPPLQARIMNWEPSHPCKRSSSQNTRIR